MGRYQEIHGEMSRYQTIHGGKGTPEYTSWVEMKRRCYNKKSPAYGEYGGRGIIVCDSWRHSFPSFLFDMGYRPSLNHSIDRIDSSGNYEPGNCRWATRSEQNSNRKNNHHFTFNGETLTIPAWGRKLGFNRSTLQKRFESGWSVERMLTERTYIVKKCNP